MSKCIITDSIRLETKQASIMLHIILYTCHDDRVICLNALIKQTCKYYHSYRYNYIISEQATIITYKMHAKRTSSVLTEDVL